MLRCAALLLFWVPLLWSGENAEKPARPIVGAIRWDAWTGGNVTGEVEKTLGPAKYQFRLPWFAEVLDEDRVRIDGGRQEVMDQEIGYAAGAGLDYWAFLIYPKDSPMSVALELYLKSARRKDVKFCAILHGSLMVAEEKWPAERARLIGLMGEPEYQKVLGSRPLVFMFHDSFLDSKHSKRLDDLISAAKAAGLNLYLVYMGWNPKGDWKNVAPRGFEAVSAYAIAGAGKFADVARQAEGNWKSALDGAVPCVPLVTTGWDKRPRMDHPVSWELTHDYHKTKTFTETATPAEIGTHLSRTLVWVREHAETCPAQTVIIYAWNENDEGGWLTPTRKADGTADTGRLDAVKAALESSAKK